ncbi:MAG: futalosine hydrolase [Bacteroidia bacterium]|nr:futalosine hydrolase [Bacteroidia bacterium]
MKILLVAATPPETAQIREQLGIEMKQSHIGSAHFDPYFIEVLHTGIGMVNTAFHLGKYFSQEKPDLAINLGIAGSFSRDFALGEVVEVVRDQFSELGAEDGEDFLDLKAMGFPLFEKGGKKYYNSLSNPHNSSLGLKKVSGITINTVHGNEQSIKKLLKRYEVVVESMEGAAFFQACLQEEVKFYAIRSISNYVERRDRSKWNIPLALSTVQNLLFQMFRESVL